LLQKDAATSGLETFNLGVSCDLRGICTKSYSSHKKTFSQEDSINIQQYNVEFVMKD
jgi:hypothetical protein